MSRSLHKLRAILPLFAGVFLSDCASKRVAVEQLSPAYVPHEVFGDVVRVTLAYNQQGAMGLSAGSASRWVLACIAMAMLVSAAVWVWRTERREPTLFAGVALVAAGALGNLVDRLRWDRGVVDFIDIGIGSTRFWIFNVADVAITVGAVVLWWATRRTGDSGIGDSGIGDSAALPPILASPILAVSACLLSACVLRGPVTDTFGFMPKPLKGGRSTPAEWGWHTATLDTISRSDSAGGVLAWWAEAPAGRARCGGALLLHGKGKNRAEMLPLGRALHDAGFAVLIPDYRGYGGSDGVPTTDGVMRDASLAYRDLRLRLADSSAPVVVVGHSMGTALAARVAREERVAAIAYLAPFSRIGSLVRARGGALGPRVFDTTAFAFNPIEDASMARGKALVAIAGRDLLIRRSVSDAFVEGLDSSRVVIRDQKASHNGLLKSPLVLQAVTDSMRAWSGCPRGDG
jgi:signal peptidase II